MKTDYTQAFLSTIQAGTPVDEALTGLHRVLTNRNHKKILVPILREVLRVLETGRGIKPAVVTTASDKISEQQRTQIAIVLRELGVSEETELKETVDETLIGGFIATFDYKEYDQSYKKALKSLYESITK